MNLFSSPDAREKPRLFLASFGKAAGTGDADTNQAFRCLLFYLFKRIAASFAK